MAERAHPRRRSVRSAVLVALAVSVFASAAAACSPEPPPVVGPVAQPVPVPVAPELTEITIGVDELVGGFNPHLLADLTPVTGAVTALLLPSAFRQRQGGGWERDDTLLDAAEVTSQDPFTVRYTIRRDASWSDTAPIAAEDFVYLADQMRSQPGVVDSAGYQLIDRVDALGGGKTVEVVFQRPYPAWRTLFRDLLPAHLLKDAPGGWPDALDAGLPVSGGPYALEYLDQARGELAMVRNDRYWGVPAGPDRLVLRTADDAATVNAMRTGGAQAALFGHPDAITARLLDVPGAPQPTVVAQPAVTSVLLRPVGATLSDERVRRAVMALLDRNALIAVGTGAGPSAALRADAQVIAPSQPGYAPTVPPGIAIGPDPLLAERLLIEAGYERGPDGWALAGAPLELVLVAPRDRDPLRVLAERVADQLRTAGVGVELRILSADELYGDSLYPATSTVAEPDLAVVSLPAAADPATGLASVHGCPLVVPAGVESAPANPTGSCDLLLQGDIERALSGRVPLDEVLPAVEAGLWDRATVLPLYQQASLLVTIEPVLGVSTGAPVEGPLASAPRWRISGQ